MITVLVDFLTGRYGASQAFQRDEAEWPPHPARLYSALAAAWFDTGKDEAEERALRELALQPAPKIRAGEPGYREVVTSFVRVNDIGLTRSKQVDASQLKLMPEWRTRQPRTFPTSLYDGEIGYHYENWLPGEETVEALSQLVRKVTYLGHSSSLVSVRLSPEPSIVDYLPDPDGELMLRVPVSNQLDALQQAWVRWQASGVRGRLPCAFQPYTKNAVTPPTQPLSAFERPIFVRRSSGPDFDLTHAHRVVSAFRSAVLSQAQAVAGAVPESISGHSANGEPTTCPHFAYLPAGHVGRPHATGRLLGVGVAAARGILQQDVRVMLEALRRIRRINSLDWHVEPCGEYDAQVTLRASTYTRPSATWASVTPVLPDRHPRRLYSTETSDLIVRACERQGLPAPVHVDLSDVSRLEGVPPAGRFYMQRGSRSASPRVHATLFFSEPVQGPILLGRGRFFGFGLFRPVHISEVLT